MRLHASRISLWIIQASAVKNLPLSTFEKKRISVRGNLFSIIIYLFFLFDLFYYFSCPCFSFI
jgi:hypothetical protein